MSNQEQPALTQYFGNPDPSDELLSLPSNSNEPVVCHIFADQPVAPIPQINQVTFTAVPNRPLPNPATFFDNISPESLSETFDQPSSNNSFNIPLKSFNTSDLQPNNAEADRRRDAWIPSNVAKKTFSRIVTPNALSPEKNLLTMPGIVLESDLSDELAHIVAHHLSEEEAQRRESRSCNDVSQDEHGLKELIQEGYFRAAINLTTRLLTTYGQGIRRIGFPSKHSPRSLQLWFTRFALLVKIQSYTLCEREAAAFDDLQNPDMYYQCYPDIYPNRSGSMASFSFRLLLAELPMHLKKPEVAIAKLHMMLGVVRKIILHLKTSLCEEGYNKEISAQDRQESLKLWSGREARIQFSVVNCALQLKDYLLAMQIVEEMTINPAWGTSHIRALHSALGRICLQAGHILGADEHFKKASSIRSTMGLNEDVRDLVDKSLLAVAQNNFKDALTYLSKASEVEPGNIMVLNNMAVCTLYSGKLKEAIAIMERAVNSNPARGLNESLLLNLCTLYELESSNTLIKKLALLQQLNKYKHDTFTDVTGCLKLNT